MADQRERPDGWRALTMESADGPRPAREDGDCRRPRPRLRAGASARCSRPKAPAEMGWLAAFLCSERAAFLTGETIRLDGGYGKSLF